MSCDRCGDEAAASVSFPSNFTADLCVSCENAWYDKLRNSALHLECIRLDALGDYLEGLAIAGQAPSFTDWYEYNLGIAKSDTALYLAAKEFLIN